MTVFLSACAIKFVIIIRIKPQELYEICGMFCLQTKGKLLDFYKERVQQFYDGHVEEVNFSGIGDLVRRRTNLLIKRQTHGDIPEYLRVSNILLRPPLALFSANIFQVRAIVKT